MYFSRARKIKIATQSLDEKELLTKLTNNDLIALEAKYHKNCLEEIVTKAKRRQSSTSGPRGNLATFDTAFESLISDIETDLNQGAAFDMSFLLTKYKEYLRQEGYDNYDSYKSERLKARLNNYFKEAIIIQPSSLTNKPDLVYSSHVNLQRTINKIAQLKGVAKAEAIESDLELPKEDPTDFELFCSALALRTSARKVEGIHLHHDIESSKICEEEMTKVALDDLYFFLCLLMFGKNPDSVHAEPDLNRRVLAVGQDIVYCASNSMCKTPKHVALAV